MQPRHGRSDPGSPAAPGQRASDALQVQENLKDAPDFTPKSEGESESESEVEGEGESESERAAFE